MGRTSLLPAFSAQVDPAPAGQAQGGPLGPLTLLGGLAYIPPLQVRKMRFGGEDHLLTAPGLAGFLMSWHLLIGRPCWAIKSKSSLIILTLHTSSILPRNF